MHSTTWAVALSVASAALLGFGAVVARIGIRYASARTGASMSVPVTTLTFWLLSPALLRFEHASLEATLMFAAVGLFFPASVTLLNFASARRLGPSIASALGASTALFSAIFAIALLHERPSIAMLCGTLVIVTGVALITFRDDDRGTAFNKAWLWMPIAAAMIRSGAQATIKYGLSLWASPFAATLVSYSVSAALLMITRPPAPEATNRDQRRAFGWFTLAGFCNGFAVLTTYAALSFGPMTLVAPLTTTSPLFAVVGSALVLQEERFDRRLLAGVLLTVIGAALLVSR
jgi:drug/metabolite transporter (DMT)-like permease